MKNNNKLLDFAWVEKSFIESVRSLNFEKVVCKFFFVFDNLVFLGGLFQRVTFSVGKVFNETFFFSFFGF